MPDEQPVKDPVCNGVPDDVGRGPGGRFAKGNRGGPGNPGIGELAQHRARFAKALKSSDVDLCLRTIRGVMRAKGAKSADRIAAARELLNRILGTPTQADLLERIERLESMLTQRNGNDHRSAN